MLKVLLVAVAATLTLPGCGGVLGAVFAEEDEDEPPRRSSGPPPWTVPDTTPPEYRSAQMPTVKGSRRGYSGEKVKQPKPFKTDRGFWPRGSNKEN